MESISDNLTKTVCKNSLAQEIFNNQVEENKAVDEAWQKEIKIPKIANEALGKRNLKIHKQKKPCFTKSKILKEKKRKDA